MIRTPLHMHSEVRVTTLSLACSPLCALDPAIAAVMQQEHAHRLPPLTILISLLLLCAEIIVCAYNIIERISESYIHGLLCQRFELRHFDQFLCALITPHWKVLRS